MGSKSLSVGLIGMVLCGWMGTALAKPPAGVHDFDVSFATCTEYVGIGLVPFEPARALLPATYTPVQLDGSAVLVVRVSSCVAVSVDGGPSHPANVAQVGIRVSGLDGSADINNYTLYYATDFGQLHGALRAAGVASVLDGQLAYAFDPESGSLEALVDTPKLPLIALSGTATPPPPTPTQFIATWWTEGNAGTVRMRTEFPHIAFGQASVLLTSEAGSELQGLIGVLPYGFALLDSYNAFDAAPMTVRAVSADD